jgi:hypothetical protein
MQLLEFVRSNALALPNLGKFGIGMALIVGTRPYAVAFGCLA